MPARIAAATVVFLVASSAAAQPGYYENARFGYVVEIPAGFSEITEADNSDGGTARSVAGAADLSVWGANLLDETFAHDIKTRIASDAAGGWSISYKAVTTVGASWSGSRGGRIMYTRAIPACAGQAAYARIEYDRASAQAFDPVVTRLALSLKRTGRCM